MSKEKKTTEEALNENMNVENTSENIEDSGNLNDSAKSENTKDNAKSEDKSNKDDKKSEDKKTKEDSKTEDKNKKDDTKSEDKPVYEDYDESETPVKKKKKFKIKKRYVALLLVAVLLGIFFIRGAVTAKNSVPYVTVENVANGDIENIISISGTVESAENITVFSEITAPISQVNVKVGDRVSAGDVLMTFDSEALALAKQTAQLAIKQANGTYANTVTAGAADAAYAQGMTPEQINARLDAIQAQIDSINNQITEKLARMNQTLADLQKVAMDINQNGIQDGSAEAVLDGNDGYVTRTEDGSSETSESNKQMALAVQESIIEVQYAINNDPEIQGWKNQITALEEEKAHLQSAKAATVTDGAKSAAYASKETTEITNEDTIAKIEEVEGGIVSGFNGVVTAVPVVEGATVSAGTQLITVANMDSVQITVQISKSDLPKIAVGQQVDSTINGKEYQGEITKISGTATKNANGVAVVDTVITLTNPDQDIILGVEASNKIHAQKAENTIVLPFEYVHTDSNGDYVYVIQDGVVARKNVTIGISSSTQAQIVEGLAVGEQIITSDADSLVEGMAVAVMPQ